MRAGPARRDAADRAPPQSGATTSRSPQAGTSQHPTADATASQSVRTTTTAPARPASTGSPPGVADLASLHHDRVPNGFSIPASPEEASPQGTLGTTIDARDHLATCR